MKKNKDGSMTELTGSNADKVRAAVKSGQTKDIQGGSKLAQMLGINKKYNVVSGGESSAARKPTVSTRSKKAPSASAKPVGRPSTSSGPSTRQSNAPKTAGSTSSGPSSRPKRGPNEAVKGVRTGPNKAAQASIDAYTTTKKKYPGGKDIGRGDPGKAKRNSTDAELARRTTERASTRKNAIGAPYARREQTSREVKKANAARQAGTTANVDKIKSIVSGGSRSTKASRK
jgi:hypothetical protein